MSKLWEPNSQTQRHWTCTRAVMHGHQVAVVDAFVYLGALTHSSVLSSYDIHSPLELHLTTSELWFGQEQEGILAAFFKSFRKGFVVCRGLDVNLSGKVAKKNDSDTEKRSPRPQCVPSLAIAVYEICHGVTEHG